MATAAVLSGTGDVIAQALDGTGGFSRRRFALLVSVNVLYIVPVLTWFYAANERLAGALGLRPGWARTGTQLAFDQLVNAPIVIAGFFTAFQTVTAAADILSGGLAVASAPAHVARSLAAQLRASYVSTVLSNWKVWVLPQLINFAFVPPYARVAFANAIALVWNVVLSVIANSS
jgi:hypothetical protein